MKKLFSALLVMSSVSLLSQVSVGIPYTEGSGVFAKITELSLRHQHRELKQFITNIPNIERFVTSADVSALIQQVKTHIKNQNYVDVVFASCGTLLGIYLIEQGLNLSNSISIEQKTRPLRVEKVMQPTLESKRWQRNFRGRNLVEIITGDSGERRLYTYTGMTSLLLCGGYLSHFVYKTYSAYATIKILENLNHQFYE